MMKPARIMATDDDFIRQYESFVRGIVLQTRRQLALDLDVDDMMAFAYEGLLLARRRFEPARGVKFRSFAYYRVRGALLDGVRSMSPLPRRAYARMKAARVVDAEAEDAQQAGAGVPAPAAPEAARQMDAILGRVAAAYCAASAAEPEEAAADEGPEAVAVARERRERTRRAIRSLPEQEALLVQGYYLEGRRLDVIAKELGMSKSWASRLHSRALGTLRKALRAQEE